MKGTLITTLVLLAGILILVSCGLQKFPEDRYQDMTPPLPPDGIGTITPGIRQIYVEWTASPSPNTHEYVIYLSTDGGSSFDDGQAAGNVLLYTITQDASGDDLLDGQLYIVGIGARSYASIDSETTTNAPTTTAPGPPSVPLATGQSTSISLEWTLSPSTTVVGYFVYIYNATSLVWERLTYLDTPLLTPFPSLPVQIDRDASGVPLLPGSTYSFRITCYDSYPLESDYVEIQNIGINPSEVTNLRATGGDQRVYLTWNQTTNPNADFYYITVIPTNPPALTWPPLLVSATSTGTTIVGLTNGTTYDFLVQVHLTTGAISAGLTVTAIPTATIDNTPPDDPSALDATPGDSEILLTWQGSPSADAVGYELGYREISSANYTYVTLGFVNSYLVTGLTNGVEYEFFLRTRDAVGNLSIPGITITATPGKPSISIDFSHPGGVYRYVNAGNHAVPSRLTLAGTANGNVAAGGTIYYTTDGTNPSTTGPSIPNDPDSQYIDMTAFAALGQRYVIVKAFFHDSGVGGSNEYGLTLKKVFHFFPASINSFQPVGGIIEQRRQHRAFLINDINNLTSPMYNQVVLFGGFSPDKLSVTSGIEIFDPTVEFFYQDANSPPAMSSPRMECSAVYLDDGRIVLLGGRFQPVTNLLSDMSGATASGTNFGEIFDPQNPLAANVVVGGVNNPRILHTATKLTTQATNNNVFVAGGIISVAQSAAITVDRDSSLTSIVVSGDLTGSILPSYFIEFTGAPPTPAALFGFGTFVVRVTYDALDGETTITVQPPMPVLPDGGEFTVTSTQTDACHLFDPTADNMINTPSVVAFPEERFGHSATLLQDGRIFFAGGHPDYIWYGSEFDLALTTLLYDPVTDTITRAGTGEDPWYSDNSAKLQEPRFFHSATLLKDGRVLIVGGIDDPWGYFAGQTGGVFYDVDPMNSTDLFDPKNQTVSDGPNMKTKRFLHAALRLLDGRILITGGIDFITTEGVPDETRSAEIYSPSTNSFSVTGSLISPRHGHEMTLLPDGRVLVTGGNDNHLAEIYDPVSGTFVATAGTLTYDRHINAASVKLSDGKVLVTGGQKRNFLDRSQEVEIAGEINFSYEVLDPDTTIFRQFTTKMIEPRHSHSITRLDDGRIIVVGGFGGTATTKTGLTTTEFFDETNGTFTPGASLSGQRYGHSAVLLRGERFYSVGSATFDGTTTVTGTGSNWISENVQAGDRIKLNADPNEAYFEIASVDSPTQLTIRSGAAFGFSIPTGAGAYTIRTERPYTAGNAVFTFGSPTVTGVNTTWNTNLRIGDLIRPASYKDGWFKILTVNSDTSLTLWTGFAGNTTPSAVTGESYSAKGNGRLLIAGGNSSGQSLRTADIYNPYNDTFATTRNTLTNFRIHHSATLLQNGWVLIVGGSSSYDRTAEVFDPAMNRFRNISDPSASNGRWVLTVAGRNNHKAALMNNGNVFIAGGEVAQGVTEFFDADPWPGSDNDNDGIESLDIGVYGVSNNFAAITAPMSVGHVYHTLSHVVGDYAVGKAIFTNGLTTVTGVGTAWLANLVAGDFIRPGNGSTALYVISIVNTNTNLTLTTAFAGQTTLYPTAGETYIAGPEHALILGGATPTATNTGDYMTWDSTTPALSLFPVAPSMARTFAHHAGLELDDNGNLILIRGHTMLIFFTR